MVPSECTSNLASLAIGKEPRCFTTVASAIGKPPRKVASIFGKKEYIANQIAKGIRNERHS